MPIHLVTVSDQGDSRAALVPERVPPTNPLPATRHPRRILDAGGIPGGARGSVSTELRSGPAAVEVMAALGSGDLLIITTHGQGAARRWQIGNVAEKLLRQATVPVVLVRADTAQRCSVDVSTNVDK